MYEWLSSLGCCHGILSLLCQGLQFFQALHVTEISITIQLKLKQKIKSFLLNFISQKKALFYMFTYKL